MGKILDCWSGETVTFRGKKYFEVDGMLVPADDAVRHVPQLMRRLQARTRAMKDVVRGKKRSDVDRTLAMLLAARQQQPDRPLKYQTLGGSQDWVETLDGIVVDGTQISNTTSETIVCPDFNIPRYWMYPGRILRLWAFGVNSNVVTTPGTLTLRVRWGGVGGVVLLASAAIGLDTAARTNALWNLTAYIVCRTVGATGTFMSGGMAAAVNVLASVGISNNGAFNNLVSMLGSAGAPIASGNAAVTVDTTVDKLLSVTAQFSVATSPTNLTCQQRIIEALN